MENTFFGLFLFIWIVCVRVRISVGVRVSECILFYIYDGCCWCCQATSFKRVAHMCVCMCLFHSEHWTYFLHFCVTIDVFFLSSRSYDRCKQTHQHIITIYMLAHTERALSWQFVAFHQSVRMATHSRCFDFDKWRKQHTTALCLPMFWHLWSYPIFRFFFFLFLSFTFRGQL